MITLYELKKNRCFRCIYKRPFYIKNCFLICLLFFSVLFTYLIYFRADSTGDYLTVLNVLKGLTSNTFNYLESHQEELGINTFSDMPVFEFSELGEDGPSTVEFMDICVSMNQPCYLPKMANAWPALKKWRQVTGGTEYLKNKLKDQKVNVYTEEKNTSPLIASRAYSFPESAVKKMTYDEFITL